MLASKLTSKYQATIPAAVREKLGVGQGDLIAFEISGGKVSLRRVTPADLEYANALTATLSEWNSGADNEAYRDL